MSACTASRRSWRVRKRTSWLVARSMKWWSVVQSALESRRLESVQLHVSFKSPPTFEMPDFERVSFRTQTYAHPRTSSTLLLSANSSVSAWIITRLKDVPSHMLRAVNPTIFAADSRVAVLASPSWHVQVSRTSVCRHLHVHAHVRVDELPHEQTYIPVFPLIMDLTS